MRVHYRMVPAGNTKPEGDSSYCLPNLVKLEFHLDEIIGHFSQFPFMARLGYRAQDGWRVVDMKGNMIGPVIISFTEGQ